MSGPPAPDGHWLIYALGGGLGHVTRGLALARAAAVRGHAVTVLANSELAAAMAGPTLTPAHGCELRRLNAALSPSALPKVIAGILTQERWAVLIVDTFPRGLAGELAPLLPAVKVPRVLVQRCLNPEYVARYNVAESVDLYDRLLVPGEPAMFDTHPRALRTAPWLIRDRAELADYGAARKRLAASSEEDLARRLVLLSGCGRHSEIACLDQIADRLQRELAPEILVRFAAPAGAAAIRHYPLLELLPGVDVLVGAGGYNTVHEARATATPLLAFAQPRLYDLQRERLRSEELVVNADELAARIRATLANMAPASERGVPQYENGVHAAVRAIETLL